MLTIRKEQMEVLSRAQEEGFINDLCIMRRVNFQNKRVNCRIKMYATISQIKTLWYYGKSRCMPVPEFHVYLWIRFRRRRTMGERYIKQPAYQTWRDKNAGTA